MGRKKQNYKNNYEFIDSAIINSATFDFYLEAFKKVALSIFEWVNLPSSMDDEYLEKCLYEMGMASILKTVDYGFINTKCCTAGNLSIYEKPVKLQCYSFDFNTTRSVYNGLNDPKKEYQECIFVRNNWDATPTILGMELFAYRLYEAERTCDINVKAQKTPIMIVADETTRLTMKNLYLKYDGNQPFIFGDKNQLNNDSIKAIKTDAPFIADKVMDYKKQIWNEALTFLGINNIMIEKKERLVSDEANSNNELINLNLQSYLAPRQRACKQFNEKYGLTGTDKEISVRVRSDLHNVIKNMESIVTEYEQKKDDEEKEVIKNG